MDFSKILSKPASAIEKPKPKPVGTYTVMIISPPDYKTMNTKNGEALKIEYKVKPLLAHEDVDQSALAASNGLEGFFPNVQIYIGTEDQLDANIWRLKDFVESCGIDTTGMSTKQMAEAPQNCQVLAVVAHRPSEDGSQLFSEIKKTMKA